MFTATVKDAVELKEGSSVGCQQSLLRVKLRVVAVLPRTDQTQGVTVRQLQMAGCCSDQEF